MVLEPVAATVPAARRELLRLFLRHGFAGFPVVKEASRKLAGVILRQDVLDHPEEDQVALLMNPNPFTTYPEATLREAARLTHDNRLRVLPVVSGSNDLVGVLTPREFLQTLGRQRGLVSGHLRRVFVPAHESTPARVALEIMSVTRASALPVLNNEGRLAGIVTDADLLGQVNVTDAVVKTVSGMGGDSDEWTWEGLRDLRRLQHTTTQMDLPRAPLRDFMVRPVLSVSVHTSVAEAATLMLTHHINQLPVVDAEQRVLDVLTDVDLVGALLT